MTKINTGGPVYPSDCVYVNGVVVPAHTLATGGMSLRAFAAINMGGFDDDVQVAFASAFNSDTHPDKEDYLSWAIWWAKANARFRCIHADALIAALGEGQ